MAPSFDRGGGSRTPGRTRSRCKVFGLEQAAPSESPGLTSAPPLVAREFGEEISNGALSQCGGPAQFRYLIWRPIRRAVARFRASPTRGSYALGPTPIFFDLDASR